jgi:VanZ family protein
MPRYYPESLRRAGVPENPVKTLVHVVEYAPLAWAFLYALGVQRPWRAFVWTALLGAASAVLDEYHQSFVPGRTATPRDVIADLAGIAAGMATWAVFVRARLGALAVWLTGVLSRRATPPQRRGPCR